MPEGDTVYRAARQLHAALAGQPLTRTDFRVPALATVDLTGRDVLEVVSRGKHLLHRLSDDTTIHSHLRMDGEWHVRRAADTTRPPSLGRKPFEARVVLSVPTAHAIGFRLPVLELVRTAEEERVVGHLGPDLLGADWDADEALRRLLDRPDLTAADALMEQRIMAGVGNVFKNELLFLRGLHPDTLVRDIPQPDKLVDLAHRLLVTNKDRLQRVTTGDTRRGQNLWVYGRAGQPCRRCGTRLQPHRHGAPTRETTTTYCPHCQPPR